MTEEERKLRDVDQLRAALRRWFLSQYKAYKATTDSEDSDRDFVVMSQIAMLAELADIMRNVTARKDWDKHLETHLRFIREHLEASDHD